MKLCKVSECDKGIYSKELCSAHYVAARRGVSVEDMVRVQKKRKQGAPKAICSTWGCKTVVLCKGLCSKHYAAERRPPVEKRIPVKCSLEGCDRLAVARGWCGTHYTRWQRHGDPTGMAACHFLVCEAPGCDKKPQGRWLCSKHYERSPERRETANRLARLRYSKDPTPKKLSAKQWQASNPERVRIKNANRRAREAEAEGFFTESEWGYVLETWDNLCAFCGIGDEPMTIEHWIPLSRGGTNWVENLAPACTSCNSSKNDSKVDEWTDRIYERY